MSASKHPEAHDNGAERLCAEVEEAINRHVAAYVTRESDDPPTNAKVARVAVETTGDFLLRRMRNTFDGDFARGVQWAAEIVANYCGTPEHVACPDCGGTGNIWASTEYGEVQAECPYCGGDGRALRRAVIRDGK